MSVDSKLEQLAQAIHQLAIAQTKHSEVERQRVINEVVLQEKKWRETRPMIAIDPAEFKIDYGVIEKIAGKQVLKYDIEARTIRPVHDPILLLLTENPLR